MLHLHHYNVNWEKIATETGATLLAEAKEKTKTNRYTHRIHAFTELLFFAVVVAIKQQITQKCWILRTSYIQNVYMCFSFRAQRVQTPTYSYMPTYICKRGTKNSNMRSVIQSVSDFLTDESFWTRALFSFHTCDFFFV